MKAVLLAFVPVAALAASVTITIDGGTACSGFAQSGSTFTCVPATTPPPPTPAPIPAPTPTPTPANLSCASQVVDFSSSFPAGSSGGGNIRKRTVNWSSGTAVAIFNTGTGTGFGRLAYGEYSSQVVNRIVSISTIPCDMNGPITSGGTNGTGYFLVGMSYPGYTTLQPNTTYYVNVQNMDTEGRPTCSGTCDLFYEIKRP